MQTRCADNRFIRKLTFIQSTIPRPVFSFSIAFHYSKRSPLSVACTRFKLQLTEQEHTTIYGVLFRKLKEPDNLSSFLFPFFSFCLLFSFFFSFLFLILVFLSSSTFFLFPYLSPFFFLSPFIL